MMKLGILLMMVLVLSAVSVDAQKRKSKRVRTKRAVPQAAVTVKQPEARTSNLAFAIDPSGWAAHPVYVGDVTVLEGRYTAKGGTRNDVETYILDEDGLVNFKNGNSTPTFYNSGGSKTVGNFTVTLAGEKLYYIVFKNPGWYATRAVTLVLTETTY